MAAETAARIAADNTLTTNIAAEVNRATATDNTLTSNMLSEFIRATGAENTLTTNLATEVTNRTNADLLKENLVNKSNNVTTDGTSTTKYPTVKSVKDYVDASLVSTGTGNISRVIAPTSDALGLILADSYSGYIIYSQLAANPSFPENLSNGFQCTIINYSSVAFVSNTLATAKFYTTTSTSGATTFTIPPGGTALVNVVTIAGEKRYYIKN